MIRPAGIFATTGALRLGSARSGTALARTNKPQKKGSSGSSSQVATDRPAPWSRALDSNVLVSSMRWVTSSSIHSCRVQWPWSAHGLKDASAASAPMSKSTAAIRGFCTAEDTVFMVQRTIVWMPPRSSSSSSSACFRHGMKRPSYISIQLACASCSGSERIRTWLRASFRKKKSSEPRSCASTYGMACSCNCPGDSFVPWTHVNIELQTLRGLSGSST
mmetsp:Transcript_50302/g.145889  ORF Transcript_50302/g.145889 Transcript_50302/m.145889 type:complete len:219 (+) Transcript_50302:233-889(+)